ncbi:MAG TPA: glycosyltransferase [Bacteroidetes bacterium]|nr:glycosyltransferase [Bacteroidota bacterium]
MSVSLIITTYNRPDALDLVFKSILKQSVSPSEIIVADDGSTNVTKKLIDSYKSKFQVPLRHVWQEDKGFRVARIRNLAIDAAKGDYIISIDGDIVLHKDFVKSHIYFAKKGFFLQGHRALLNPKFTEQVLKNDSIDYLIWDRGISNRKNTIHNLVLAKFFSFKSKKINGLMGGLMSFWKADAMKINGYDEDFIGWGKEDSDFGVRLLNSGLWRRDLRFCAVAFHLDHLKDNRMNTKKFYKKNLSILDSSISNKTVVCKNGIKKL